METAETAERMTMGAFVAAHGITATVRQGVSNPHMDDSPYMTRHFRVVLRRDGRQMTVAYSQGSAFTEEPTAEDVLSCLCQDAAGLENNPAFEVWAPEYGFDADSRKAERIFREVERQAARLKVLLGEEYEAALWDVESD